METYLGTSETVVIGDDACLEDGHGVAEDGSGRQRQKDGGDA